MSPSTADFSQIMELHQYRKLYEEQEEKFKIRMTRTRKKRSIGRLDHTIADRDNQIQELAHADGRDGAVKPTNCVNEYARLRKEAQEKIDKLSERIKELNQQDSWVASKSRWLYSPPAALWPQRAERQTPEPLHASRSWPSICCRRMAARIRPSCDARLDSQMQVLLQVLSGDQSGWVDRRSSSPFWVASSMA